MKTITEILKRLKMLVIKIISIKGVAFVIASIALIAGAMDGYTWLIITGLVIGTRALEKIKGIVKPE
jgi:hypothetical protein